MAEHHGAAARRKGLLITAHFQTADKLGVPRDRAMQIMREELWTRGRPTQDRVQAATERLRKEAP